MMRSAREEFWAINVRPRNVSTSILMPPEAVGLMEATSTFGSASAGNDLRGGGGAGISHAVPFVERTKSRGWETTAWVHVPAMVLPAVFILPSYAVPLISIAN